MTLTPLMTRASASATARIHLRGIARIDAHAARSQGKLVLSGTVSDDLGGTARGVKVAIQIATAGGTNLPLAALAPAMCIDTAQPPVLEGSDRMVVPTTAGAAGTPTRFCVKFAVPEGRYTAHLEARSAGLLDGARMELPIDLAISTVTLRFDPEPTVRALDEGDVAIEAIAETEDDGITRPVADLPLVLSNESGTPLGGAEHPASAVTDATGRARFAVDSAKLGPPGLGELRVSFAGSPEAGSRTHVSPVERTTHVELAFPDAVGGRLPVGSPVSGVTVRVAAKASCASHGCADSTASVASPLGTIEVRLANGGIVGAETLRDGMAKVVITFLQPAETEGTDETLEVRYVPLARWFSAASATDPARLVQPIRPPSPWGRISLAAAGLLVLVWLGVGRLAGRLGLLESGTRQGPHAKRDGLREGMADATPRVESLESGDLAATGTSASGWRGMVVDLHERSPIAGARIAIERPGFERAETLAEAHADAEGRFVLALDDVRPGDQLTVDAPLHASMRIAVPKRGEIRVSVIARRRALIDRLVVWARQRGRPFDDGLEPTPDQVRRVARAVAEARGDGSGSHAPARMEAHMGGNGESGEAMREASGKAEPEANLEAWAASVGRAAFGGETVDAQREAEVDRLAPSGAAAPPGSRPR